MRSFTTFTVLLTAALSTFTNAAPIALRGASVPVDLSSPMSEVTDLTDEFNVPDLRRETEIGAEVEPGLDPSQSTPSVAYIFTTLFTQIQPLTEQLTYITPDNATVAAVTPVVAQIKTQLTSVVSQLQGLVGKDSSVILAPVEGTVSMTVAELAALIAGDLCLLFTALAAVLKVVVGDVRTEILPMLADLGSDVASILTIVVALVAGIVTSLAPLLAPVVAVISSLGLADLLSLLGLSI